MSDPVSSTKIVVQRDSSGAIAPLTLRTGVAHLVEIPSGVTRVHFAGPAFAVDKCMLLPAATEGIRGLRTIFGESPGAQVLVIGHTDDSGSTDHNRTLSLARARSIAAFLTDDVDTWLEFFSNDPPGGDRWGMEEVIHMLSVLPVGEEPFFSEGQGSADAIRRFQEATGMDPNGHADDDVHRELVTRYMALDGTSLPADTTVVAHGCGESHPLGGPTAEDRRVEVLLFHPQIEPTPASETSTDEYPQWLEAVTQERDIEVGLDPAEHLELRLHDADRNPMPQTPFRVRVAGMDPVVGVSDDEGFVFIRLPPACPESILVEWGDDPILGLEYAVDVFPSCSPGDPLSRAIARLNNLGYSPLIDLEAAVRHFQLDYRVDDNPIQGLVDGGLPPQTQQKLDAIWDERRGDAGLP